MLADWSEVLRTGEVQEILGVRRKEVHRLIADGPLPAVRAGRGYRIQTAALPEWLNTHPHRIKMRIRGTEKKKNRQQ